LTVPLTAQPLHAGAACATLWCAILFAPAVLLQLGGRPIVWVILAATLLYLGGQWILYFAMPELGRTLDEEGLVRFGDAPNQVGIQCTWAVGMLLILGTARLARWKLLLFPIGFVLLTLLLADSRTSMISTFAVAAMFCLRRVKTTPLAITGCFALAIVIGAAGFVDFNSEGLLTSLSRSGEIEEIQSFTGRTKIWEFAFESIRQSPYVGYGYGASRIPFSDFTINGVDYGVLLDAHNLVLNVTLCTGVVGGVLVATMLLHQTGALLTSPDAFPDAVTTVVLVDGLMESLAFGSTLGASTVILLIALWWRQSGATLGGGPLRNPGES